MKRKILILTLILVLGITFTGQCKLGTVETFEKDYEEFTEKQMQKYFNTDELNVWAAARYFSRKSTHKEAKKKGDLNFKIYKYYKPNKTSCILKNSVENIYEVTINFQYTSTWINDEKMVGESWVDVKRYGKEKFGLIECDNFIFVEETK